MPRIPVVQPDDMEELEGKEEEKRKTPDQEEEQRAREEEEEEGDIFGESDPEEEEGREGEALKIKVEHVQEEDGEKRGEGGEKESSEPLERYLSTLNPSYDVTTMTVNLNFCTRLAKELLEVTYLTQLIVILMFVHYLVLRS